MNADHVWDDTAFRDRIQRVLDVAVDRQAARLDGLGPDAAHLIAQARVSVAGGKRFRAAFCWWGYRAIRPEPASEQALADAAASLELLHASALVHDDLMDASESRRGRPTTHRFFTDAHQRAGWRGDASQYGAAGAILLGDLLLSWADELLRRCGLPVDDVARGLDYFDLCRAEVIAGQFLDVSVQARGHADVDAAMQVLRYKSAKYSIERPLHIGAALAGADEDQLRQLSSFGLPLGEAFQLRDDLLGVFGDPAVTGKPAGDDLIEGKRTVLIALALDGASRGDAALLDRSLGSALTPGQIDHLRRVIDASGAREQVETVIDELTVRARSALAQSGFDPLATQVLDHLAEAATRRTM